MRAQIQANTGNFGRQRFSLHGVDLTKFDGGAHVVCKFFLGWPSQKQAAAGSLAAVRAMVRARVSPESGFTHLRIQSKVLKTLD